MVTNSEIAEHSEPDLHYALCAANLKAAHRLCQDMIDGNFTITYSHATVIMSLVHHAVELFLKYAISITGKKTPTHHYIRGLLRDYDIAYSDGRFRLDVPFVTQYLGYTEEEVKIIIKGEEQDKNKIDQMWRYHCDRSGKPWAGIYEFTPPSFLAEVESLAQRFAVLKREIETNNGN